MFQKLQSLSFLAIGILFLVFSTQSYGQKYKISGVVKDTLNESLEATTVFMQSLKDSTVIDYTITKKDGKFSLEGKTNEDEANLFVSYTGYKDYRKKISIKEDTEVDLGEIILKNTSSTLEEVVIQGMAPPIRMKKDTLEFNVSSFKTKENANLEDLLKKLPGVTVSNDGSIEVNGKEVKKIKVNGKDFFGDDPKIATKNLPKDLLEKVQIVDNKTKSEEFTGEETDSEEKAINLTIREENNKGLFARLTAGGGTDQRYSFNGIGNYFDNDMRMSVLGSANNINSTGFSFDEVYDAMGNNAYSIMGGANNSGITKSQAAGADFVNSWEETTDLSANYFYNRTSTDTEGKVERENILPDRHYFNNSNSTSKSINNNHRGNIQLEIEPDTLTRINIRPNITADKGYSKNESYTESIDADGTKLNNSTTEQHSDNNSVNFSNRIDVTRKFGNEGGFYRVGFTNRNNRSKHKRSNYTTRDIYDKNEELENNEVQDQLINQDRKRDEYSLNARARLPLSKKWNLDLNYQYVNSKDENERLLYETDENGDTYDILNNDLSSNFKSQTFQHKPQAGVVFRGDKLNAGLSGGLESVRLKNDEKFTETNFDNTFNNLFARFYVRYRINQMQSLYFNFNNSRSIPSITQLQPVSNTTNPLNTVTGNPNLKPSLNNNFSLNYHNYNFKTHSGFGVFMRGGLNNDQVVAKTTTDEDLVKTTTYTNVDGQYNFSVGVNGHKEYSFKDKSTLRPRIGLRSSINKGIGYSNGIKYHSKNLSFGPRVSLEYDVPDIITVEPSYNIGYNNRKYSLSNQSDQSYSNHTVRMRITSYWPENLIFGNDITYTHNGQTGPDFDNDYILWNMSLGYKLWDGDGIAKVKVFDLLNQNVSSQRNTGDDYVQDIQQLVLKRYLMVSFTYKINKFGGKKTSGSRGGGRGRHMRRL